MFETIANASRAGLGLLMVVVVVGVIVMVMMWVAMLLTGLSRWRSSSVVVVVPWPTTKQHPLPQ